MRMHDHSFKPYAKFAVMMLVSFAVMYVAMFAMIDRASYFHNNLNMAYMAALMAAPMAIVMIALMWDMYPFRALNFALMGLAAVVLVACFAAIRGQAGIDNVQFLKAMIPHHSGAILMCREAAVTDAQIQDLCRRIIAGQQAEIDEMEARLTALER